MIIEEHPCVESLLRKVSLLEKKHRKSKEKRAYYCLIFQVNGTMIKMNWN